MKPRLTHLEPPVPHPSCPNPQALSARTSVRHADPALPLAQQVTAAVLLIALLIIVAPAARSAPPDYGPAFDQAWHDGKAELASYDLTYTRYGQTRSGTAATVIVTEPFSDAARVKSDRGGPGTFGALKFNIAEDFPTGVYDYNLMTSVFVATEACGLLSPGDVAKLSFSSQEWCGHVWQQAAFRPAGAPGTVEQIHHSYFEFEGDAATRIAHPQDGFAEDALILWARGLAGPTLAPGESVEIPLYRSAAIQRLRHLPAAWDTATLSRDSKTQATATIESNRGPRTYTFTLDDTGMLTKLERSDGYSLKLRGVERMPYWSQNRNADQQRLKAIGLEPRGPGQM